MPLLPQAREQIVLEGEWSETADGHNFILANEGDVDKLLIFGSIEGLSKIARANTLYMDGTFYSAPNLFAQLYTVHAKVYDQMFPLLYGLLPDRRQRTHERFINLIVDAANENNEVFQPDTIMVDYEMGSIQAYRTTLPQTEIKGSLFHRCIQRIEMLKQTLR
jgi:hypothetical protein